MTFTLNKEPWENWIFHQKKMSQPSASSSNDSPINEKKIDELFQRAFELVSNIQQEPILIEDLEINELFEDVQRNSDDNKAPQSA